MRNPNRLKKRVKQCCASILGAAIAVSLFIPPAPLSTNASAAVSYAEPYLEKLNQWNIMLGDETGDLRPNDLITRAEFIAMINRSYGFTDAGDGTSFSDVDEEAWYANDIAIAKNAGYFTGISDSSAEPDSLLTREQAMVLLAKSGRLESIPGEVTEFSDGQDFSPWGSGYVKAAVKRNLISGYPDGTFRPQSNITRAEVSCLLCNALGTLINTGGTRELGDWYGNVTINAPGTTLKNTTIAGDLFLSGGLGLGAVTLENVEVLGRIIVAGGGESEQGDDSIILRNVEAPELIVDNLANNYLSVRAEGDTTINQTYLRSSTFLRDRTQDGAGLENITLDGTTNGLSYTLAGDLQNIIDKSPFSTLNIGEGTVETLTMDELAAGGNLNIDYNATVKNLNLDTGVPVTGNGDVQSAVVSANGTSTEMLPDKITMRPGVTANVAGTNMNTTVAQEVAVDPKLLAGYPNIKDIAPTSASAEFSTNKSGTIYWAVSAVTDGSIKEADLISPPSYSTKSLKHGNLRAAESNTVYTASISGLSKGGSYYLSAVMVDERGTHSTVKVVSFTTPDDTAPNFASGYPYMSKVTNKDAQVNVMATKDCNVHYALYDQGSTAPTADDFKNGRVTDSLGHGVVALNKNLPDLFQVNDRDLDEVKTYDLYLWLNDADNAKSSAVKKLTFTTVDKTPPIFLAELAVNNIQNNSIGGTAQLNENGTLFWVVVPESTVYPTPLPGSTLPPALDSTAAKLQVVNGNGALRRGQVNMRESIDTTVNMTGLQPATPYDIYYVARDTAGNYSKEVIKITSHTKDTIPPTAEQSFSNFTGDRENPKPYANTDIEITFSESVYYYNSKDKSSTSILQKYDEYQTMLRDATATEADKTNARNVFREILRNTIKLYNSTAGQPTQVKERDPSAAENDGWVIDYSNAEIEYTRNRELIVRFRSVRENGTATDKSALNLSSGGTYFFRLENIQDASENPMRPAVTDLKPFTTIASEIAITDLNMSAQDIKLGKVEEDGTVTPTDETTKSDVGFSLTPKSTSTTDSSIVWDMLIMADKNITFELYKSTRDSATANPLNNIWTKVLPDNDPTAVSNEQVVPVDSTSTGFEGVSHTYRFRGLRRFDALNTLDDSGKLYDYAINITKIGGSSDRADWTDTIHFRIYTVSGMNNDLNELAINLNETYLNNVLTNGKVTNLGVPEMLETSAPFSDTNPPKFEDNFPTFLSTDTNVNIDVLTNRDATVYYAIAPAIKTAASSGGYDDTRDPNNNGKKWIWKPSFITRYINSNGQEEDLVDFLSVPPNHRGDTIPDKPLELTSPSYLSIVNPSPGGNDNSVKYGNVSVNDRKVTISVRDLAPNQDYYVYFVLKGTQVYSKVMLYAFTTKEVTRPVIELQLSNPTVNVKSDINANVQYMLIPYNDKMDAQFSAPFRTVVRDDAREEMKSIFTDAVIEQYIGENSTFTVLNALTTNVMNDDGTASIGSLFDLYAKQYYADNLATFIRGSTPTPSGTVAGTGTVTVPGGTMRPVDCSRMKMTPGTEYAFIAVGRSNQGSGDAFRAIYPVSIIDAEAPKVTQIVNGMMITQYDNFKGNFTLIFDKDLYHTVSGDPPKISQVDEGTAIDTLNKRPKGFTSVNSFLYSKTDGFDFDTNPEKAGTPTKAITIKCTGAPASQPATITLKDITSSDGRGRRNYLVVTLTKVLRNPDKPPENPTWQDYVVDISITPEWDGR